MYSDKKNILELVALLHKFGVKHIVLSPGSRNAPLIHTFTHHPSFKCYTVVDERSAGYFALGLIMKHQCPVAVCCTSGTAMLNYSSAVAEAFYQQLPLLVISADRPQMWIGQNDGQTLPQPGVFGNLVHKSVQLPEVNSQEEAWYCNRLINEALLCLTSDQKGPVHINIQLGEPLYEFTVKELPDVRKVVRRQAYNDFDIADYSLAWNKSHKRIILVGQLLPGNNLGPLLKQLSLQSDVVIFAEHTANLDETGACVTSSFDAILSMLGKVESDQLTPDLLITIGGHIVSKRVKNWLRKATPTHNWHVAENGEFIDTFQSLTDIIPLAPRQFLKKLNKEVKHDSSKEYQEKWRGYEKRVRLIADTYFKESPFSDMMAVDHVIKHIPQYISIHWGNSTPVRYGQLFDMPLGTKHFSNRGTSGIDGVVSTAIGYATDNETITLLVIGDLSFFYDMNGLWNKHVNSQMRIVLMNNSGGGIFRVLGGPSNSDSMENYIACSHQTTAKGWAETVGFEYRSATNFDELDQELTTFFDPTASQPILLEVFTPADINPEVFRVFYGRLRGIN